MLAGEIPGNPRGTGRVDRPALDRAATRPLNAPPVPGPELARLATDRAGTRPLGDRSLALAPFGSGELRAINVPDLPAAPAATPKPTASGLVPTLARIAKAMPTGAAITTMETATNITDNAVEVASKVAEASAAPTRAASRLTMAGRALGVAGMAVAASNFVRAFANTPVDKGALTSSAADFASCLWGAADDLSAIPGLNKAITALGGIGGVVAGIMQGIDTYNQAKEEGATFSVGLGAAASIGLTVGGFMVAISPFFPPALALGTTILAAGAAFNLAKMAWDNRETIVKVATNTVRAIGHGARAIGDAATDIASRLTRPMQHAWTWLKPAPG